jgi:hypothetical protein
LQALNGEEPENRMSGIRQVHAEIQDKIEEIQGKASRILQGLLALSGCGDGRPFALCISARA